MGERFATALPSAPGKSLHKRFYLQVPRANVPMERAIEKRLLHIGRRKSAAHKEDGPAHNWRGSTHCPCEFPISAWETIKNEFELSNPNDNTRTALNIDGISTAHQYYR